MSDAAVAKFGQWITAETFDTIDDDIPPTEQAQHFQDFLMSKLDELCPIKSFKLSSQDKQWVNGEIKSLNRRKMREWRKRGKTKKYDNLLKQYEEQFKLAAQKFLRSKIDGLKEAKPGKAFGILKD